METQVSIAQPASQRTISPLWRLVAKRVSPIAVLNNGDGRLPLYCIHPITGGITCMQNLATQMGPEQSVYGIQVPREKMHASFGSSIEALARHHVDALVDFQPEGPIALGGWSAGSVVMFEMAQQLRALGREVPLLAAFDGAPCNSGAGLSTQHPLYYLKLALNLPAYIKDDFKVNDWSWAGLVKRFNFKLNLVLPTPRDAHTLDAGAVRNQLATPGWKGDQQSFMRAFYEAMQNYVPKHYDGHVVVYEMQTQSLLHLRQIGAVWKKLAANSDIVKLKGRHEAFLTKSNEDVVGNNLRNRLIVLRDAIYT